MMATPPTSTLFPSTTLFRSDAELFGVQYGYPTASTSVGEDGEFEIFLWLGEYELRPYSQMGGERATARFSGNLTVRPAAREASVTFGMPQVAFHVLEGLIHCSEFGQCWSTPGRSLAWGKTEAAETVFTTGRFAGLVAGDSLSWRLVRAGVVLAGKCNSSRLDRYMVVETSGISVSRQNVWPEDVRDQFVPNFYAEVVCRRQAIAAARGM